MKSRVSAAAVVAIVLWGLTISVPTARAQGEASTVAPAGQALADDGLQKMLQDMGYEPKKLSKGYLIAIMRDTWTFNTQLTLSDDGTKLGMNANLGRVEKPDEVTAQQWSALLAENREIDPSSFYYDKDVKKLYLHRVLDNRAVTPSFLRQQVDGFCANVKDTEALWKFTK